MTLRAQYRSVGQKGVVGQSVEFVRWNGEAMPFLLFTNRLAMNQYMKDVRLFQIKINLSRSKIIFCSEIETK